MDGQGPMARRSTRSKASVSLTCGGQPDRDENRTPVLFPTRRKPAAEKPQRPDARKRESVRRAKAERACLRCDAKDPRLLEFHNPGRLGITLRRMASLSWLEMQKETGGLYGALYPLQAGIRGNSRREALGGSAAHSWSRVSLRSRPDGSTAMAPDRESPTNPDKCGMISTRTVVLTFMASRL